jgi:hypothetical protein
LENNSKWRRIDFLTEIQLQRHLAALLEEFFYANLLKISCFILKSRKVFNKKLVLLSTTIISIFEVKKMDFRPTLISPPSWIFLSKIQRNRVQRPEIYLNDISPSLPPSIAHGKTIGTTLARARGEIKAEILREFQANLSLLRLFKMLKNALKLVRYFIIKSCN